MTAVLNTIAGIGVTAFGVLMLLGLLFGGFTTEPAHFWPLSWFFCASLLWGGMRLLWSPT